MKKAKSLRTIIFIAIIPTLILTIIIIILPYLKIYQSMYSNTKHLMEDKIFSVGKKIRKLVNENLEHFSLDSFSGMNLYLNGILNRNKTLSYCFISNSKKIILYHTNEKYINKILNSTRYKHISFGNDFSKHTLSINEYFELIFPIKKSDKIIGAIHIGIKKKWVKAKISSLILFSIIVLIVFLTIRIFLLYFLLKKYIINTISSLAEKAFYISSHRSLDQRINIEGSNELNLLANAFNSMIESLETYYHDLQNKVEEVHESKEEYRKLLQNLEVLVKQRTAQLAIEKQKANAAQKSAENANKAKSIFLANMSHELRTLLNAIIGFSDILKNEVMGDIGQDIYKEYASDINNSGVGLLKIINEILDISKIEAGDRDLSESEFYIQDVLTSCIDLYSPRLKDKNITLNNETENMPILRGEELAIKQVIGNVYVNAIQYTQTGGRLTVFTDFDNDGNFRLSVNDTGIGMSSREVSKALSSFGQVDNSLDRDGAGIGLGLPLAQAMMGAHGGQVEILSEKGIGTTVTLVFPKDRITIRDEIKTED